MAKYFTLLELCKSDVAVKNNIDNTPPMTARVNLIALMNQCLDPIREAYGNPIYVNSGFRSPTVNKMVGGAPTSQHTKGQAADITTGNPKNNKKLFDMIISKGFKFDQLIDERNYAWLHISWKSENNRQQIIHQ